MERVYLEFADREGTDLALFATFRLRGTWAKRLRKGTVVFLADSKLKVIYGRAKVVAVHMGRANDMLDTHAHMSHLSLAGGLSRAQAIDARFTSLERLYGPQRFSGASILSVVYLKRTV